MDNFHLVSLMNHIVFLRDDSDDGADGIDCQEMHCKKRCIINSFLATLSLSIFSFLLYISYHVFKKIKFNNKIILGMIIFMILDIFGKYHF